MPNPTPPLRPDWDRIAHTDAFRSLLKAKARFIVPATIFFLAYYFLLPILVGYAPEFMSQPILGPLNGAYLFALSQFLMAWAVAWLYMRAAAGFDRRAAEILKNAGEDSPR